jgi:hypothetical protein
VADTLVTQLFEGAFKLVLFGFGCVVFVFVVWPAFVLFVRVMNNR